MKITTITILVNRKADLEQIKTSIIDSKIEFPIYIFEYENHFQIQFINDYEEWELDNKILDCFSDCEFVGELDNGRKEIRLQISRQKDEDPYYESAINETKFLVRKSNKKIEKFNPQVKVLFKEEERSYFVNIVSGQIPTTGEKGFLLLTNFYSKNTTDNESEFFKETLYKSPIEAFQYGYYKMQELVEKDFSDFIQIKTKEKQGLHKIPRKIVRDFINSCNNNETTGILKDIDNCIIYEKRLQCQTEKQTEGIKEFETYLKSSNQDLCSMNFKIRTFWNIKLPNIEIGVKFYPLKEDSEKEENECLKYRQFKFLINNNKIVSIMEEQ